MSEDRHDVVFSETLAWRRYDPATSVGSSGTGTGKQLQLCFKVYAQEFHRAMGSGMHPKQP